MDEKKTTTSTPVEKKDTTTNVLVIVASVLFGMFVIVAVAGYFVYTKVKDVIEEEVQVNSFEELFEDEIDGLVNSDLTENIRRDAQIEVMLDQYEQVVAATDASVSWEEYLDELDAFIVLLTELTEIDPDPTIIEALQKFKDAKAAYAEAVQLENEDAPVDQAGVELGGQYIDEAQDLANEYLDKIGY